MNKITKWVIDKYTAKIQARIDELNPISSAIVFSQRYDGHHSYRIPAIIALPGNIVCAFAEGRIHSISDYAHMNLVLKRSVDGGKTWGELQILMKNDEGLQIHNPCPVYDRITKDLFVLVTKSRLQPYILKSTDLGKTWSDPKKIEGINPRGWEGFNGPSPGHAIQLESGRLLITGMYNEKKDDIEEFWGNYYFYSDDHGKTWVLGHVFPPLANESLSAKLGGNRVYTIARTEKPEKKVKLVAISEDGGESASSMDYNSDLHGPICQSSIIEYGNDSLLFSSPVGKYRRNMTLRVSKDGGKTFPIKKLIYKAFSIYSDLTIFEDGTIGLLFECGHKKHLETIAFIRLNRI